MSLSNDIKYASMLSTYLANFKRKKETVWNFRCPICLDSKKNSSKSRGYIYRPTNKNYLAVKCYNCDYSSIFGKFLNVIDGTLYKEYLMEAYQENEQHVRLPYKEDILPDIFQEMELSDGVLDSLHRIDKLPENHPVVKYVASRFIPKTCYNLLYFSTKFKLYTNSVVPNTFSSLENDHPRLIIPYLNKHGKCFAFQGRAFGKEQPKYITVKIDKNCERIYGLDRVNYNKQILVLEGPIDSLFLPNAIAVSGSSYSTSFIEQLKSNCIIVPDNERRSSEICKIINKMIDRGYKVCLWPDSYTHKDINDAVKGGMSSKEIFDIINANVYQGMAAKLKFTRWKK